MIVIRRFFALLFIPIFVVWFVAMTFRSGLDRTLFDDGFITGQLEEQDVYNWLHDDLIRVALDDTANVGIEVDSQFLPSGQTTVSFADPEVTRDEARSLLYATFPPEYLQQTAEEVLSQFMPYVRGETDEFDIALGLNERVSGFFSGVRETYVDIDTANILVNGLISPAAYQAALDFTEGPFGLVLTPEQAADAARTIAPPEWIDQQVFKTIDELDSYLSGRSDTLAVNISFRDRVPVAAQVVKDILSESNAEQVIFDTLVKPEITRQIGRATLLSYAIEIDDDEITRAVETIAPPEWVRGHLNAIVDAVAAYMARETANLTYTVDLTDQRDAAVEVLIDLAIGEALDAVNALPQCGNLLDAQRAILAIQSGGLPTCTDPALPVELLLNQVGAALESDIKRSIGDAFPASVTYDQTLFTGAIGAERASDLENVRDQIANGITIDISDVLDQLSDQEDTAQRFLDIIRTDRPFTDDDFTTYRQERATSVGNDELDDIDTFRGGLGLALGEVGAAVAIGVGLVFLFLIGVLGGRAWSSRLIWAGSALAFAALLVWLAFAQVLSGYGADIAEDRLVEEIDAQILVERAQGDPTGMLELARDEGVAKARAIGDAITGEFAGYAALWFFAGVIAVLIGIAIRVAVNRPERPAALR